MTTHKILPNSCRVCFSHCKRSDVEVQEISEIFYESTGFVINTSDVPKKICEICLKKLRKSYKFKQECARADKILAAYRPEILIEPKMEIEETCEVEPVMIGIKNETNDEWKSENVEDFRTKSPPITNVGVRKVRKSSKEKVKKPKKVIQARVICELCGKDILKSRLTDHIGAKHNSKRFECDLCGSSYVEKANLIRHMFYKHLKNQRQYPCPYCDKIYEQSGSRSLHIKKIHTNDLPHVCEVCGKRFVKPSKLKYHLATHSGEIFFY